MNKKPICPICKQPLDPDKLSAKDDKGRAVHISCLVNKSFKPEEGLPF